MGRGCERMCDPKWETRGMLFSPGKRGSSGARDSPCTPASLGWPRETELDHAPGVRETRVRSTDTIYFICLL